MNFNSGRRGWGEGQKGRRSGAKSDVVVAKGAAKFDWGKMEEEAQGSEVEGTGGGGI